ncbi:MAG: hypothetical protein ACQESR_03125 [Planctomycetota bacterium]
MSSLQEYYAEEVVRQRMVEFLGGHRLEETSCVYITADDCSPICDFRPRPPRELWDCLEQGMEVKRSLWDRRSLVVHVDIEYVNFDYPAEPYLNPRRSLDLQRPVVRLLREHLLRYGIAPLHLLSGRGHHLVWRTERDSPAFRQLAHVGMFSDTLQGMYQTVQPPGEMVGLETGAAFAGVGQALEFVAGQVLRDVRPGSPIPVELSEVETGRGERGREIICLDLSEYGDPLNKRMVRIPFSAYHKPQQRRAALGGHVVDELPRLFLVPLFETSEQEGLRAMRHAEVAADLARYASVEIPEQNEGTSRLTEAYAGSRTARFHQWFYSQEHEPPGRWPESYDRTPVDSLPPCARRILTQPNDALLKPVGIRLLVRVLLALGWHPRHVAGLIRSKYERNFGWGNTFFQYDAATRADFYTRLFAGLIVGRIDTLEDFRCEDLKAVGLCGPETCDHSLLRFRQSLAERICHERLACRPIHGLFLPDQHL